MRFDTSGRVAFNSAMGLQPKSSARSITMANDYTTDLHHRDPQDAFEHAIKVGALSTTPAAPNYVGNYMYMYTTDGADYFKHIDTREYYKVSHS